MRFQWRQVVGHSQEPLRAHRCHIRLHSRRAQPVPHGPQTVEMRAEARALLGSGARARAAGTAGAQTAAAAAGAGCAAPVGGSGGASGGASSRAAASTGGRSSSAAARHGAAVRLRLHHHPDHFVRPPFALLPDIVVVVVRLHEAPGHGHDVW